MKILWVATKAPWPLIDGGRLVQWHTIAALANAGAEITVVAPADAVLHADAVAARLHPICRPMLVSHARPTWARAFADAMLRCEPLAITRHRIAPVRLKIQQLLAREHFDVVHAEQLQALSNCAHVQYPVVLRAQNVESDLWFALAKHRPILRPLLNFEAGRLRGWEAEAVLRCTATIALTTNDAARLEVIAKARSKVHRIAAPFPAELPGGETRTLAGRPALVIFGSSRWAPNRDGAEWFVREIWPAVVGRLPNATLHLYNGGASTPARNVFEHAAPDESAEAFPREAILIVPLRIASGVRMKILEAWARGIPVVATPEAAQGLDATEGRELLIARRPGEFASAIAKLTEDAPVRRAMVAAANELLRTKHNPAAIAQEILAVYREAITFRKSL